MRLKVNIGQKWRMSYVIYMRGKNNERHKESEGGASVSKLIMLKELLPTVLFVSGLIAIVTSAYLFNSIIGTLVLGSVLLFCGWLLTPTSKAGGSR